MSNEHPKIAETALRVDAPYLLFLGDTHNALDAKTARGLAHWCPERCLGQLVLTPGTLDIGLPPMSARMASDHGAKSLVVGVAPSGGSYSDAWREAFASALDAGLDVVSGLHQRLNDDAELVERARERGKRLVDVRTAPVLTTVATGAHRSGKRLLTVGTDCCVGKKYTALAMHRALASAGRDATFRATGQTGILIAGQGIPIDAVVADFVAAAAERLSPDADADHWDLIEGQGSLFHPAYAAVTLGLIHGSQPDALVLCHDPSRRSIDEYPNYPIPELPDAIEAAERAARLTNPNARCIGISINTSALPASSRRETLARAEQLTGLPAVDPVADGPQRLVAALP